MKPVININLKMKLTLVDHKSGPNIVVNRCMAIIVNCASVTSTLPNRNVPKKNIDNFRHLKFEL
jgi:hypothetical protein